MAETVRAVVLRGSADETTLAIVTVRRTHYVTAASQLFERIKNAVTKWVRETEHGREAYADSSEDFNVGDLSEHIERTTLKPFLEEQGLHDVTIEIISNTDFQNNWTYDTHLVGDLAEDDDGS